MRAIIDFMKTNFWLPVVVVLVAVALWQLVDPAPPRELTIATGSEEGRYYRLAKLLQADMAQQGIRLHVISTAGSGDNMQALTNPRSDVAIAFVQSGMEQMVDTGNVTLASLGSFYYEPIWLFYRTDTPIRRVTDLKGMKVGIGAPGSGTQLVARYIAKENGLDDAAGNVTFIERDADDTVELLRTGAIDAALFTVSPQSARIGVLLALPGIDFLNIERSEAYTARYPFLSSVTIYEGLLDLERNIPAQDRTTLASTAMLVVNERFHPSLTPLILESLSTRLAKGGMLEKPQEFPSPDNVDFALTKEARHYYAYGAPFLLRYLPFWAASLVDRLVIFIIPLLVILVPLSKLAGPIYRWRIRSRIYRWYRYLLEIERGLATGEVKDRQAEQQRLQRMTDELAVMEVPLSYADELYHLKAHLEYLKQRLKQATPEPPQ